jgi:hypothetical protein
VKWNSFNRWRVFAAAPGIGFGLIHEKNGAEYVTDYVERFDAMINNEVAYIAADAVEKGLLKRCADGKPSDRLSRIWKGFPMGL